MSDQRESQKRYSPRSVITAQRRVLRLAMRMIGQKFTSGALYADGKSLWTTEELLDHIQQASSLKVDFGTKKRSNAKR